jgi:hypothetical protein
MANKKPNFLSTITDENGQLNDAGIGAIADTATNIVGAATADDVHKGQARGQAIGAAGGAALGMAFGLPPQIGGAVGGALGSLIGAGGDRHRMERNETELKNRKNFMLDLMENSDPYGQFEEGGAVSPEGAPVQSPAPAPKKRINVQKGELIADRNGNIIQEFTNPNRFQKHAENFFEEPIGNFVDADPDHIVVPADKVKLFKSGDELTRRSILRQLVDNQVQNPGQNAINFAEGGYTGDPEEIDPFTGLPKPKQLVQSQQGHYNWDIPAGLPAGVQRPEAPKREWKPLPPIDANIGAPEQQLNVNPNQSVMNVDGTVGSPVENINTDGIKLGPENSNKPVTTGKGRGYSMALRSILGTIPGAVQGIRTFQSDPFLGHEYNSGFADAKAAIGQMPDSISVNDQIAEIDNSAALAIEGLRNTNSPSARAEIANVMVKAARAKGEVIASANRTNAGMRTNKLAQIAGLETAEGQSDQMERVRVQNEQRMDQATRENIQSGVLDQNYRMFAGAQNDREKIDAINHMTRFEDIDINGLDRYTEDPEARDYIYSYITKGGSLKDAIAAYNNYKTTAVVQKDKNFKNRYGVPMGGSSETTVIKRPAKTTN